MPREDFNIYRCVGNEWSDIATVITHNLSISSTVLLQEHAGILQSVVRAIKWGNFLMSLMMEFLGYVTHARA